MAEPAAAADATQGMQAGRVDMTHTPTPWMTRGQMDGKASKRKSAGRESGKADVLFGCRRRVTRGNCGRVGRAVAVAGGSSGCSLAGQSLACASCARRGDAVSTVAHGLGWQVALVHAF